MRHAKIVCTIGPATSGLENAKLLLEAGMNIARLNFSHGDASVHRKAYQDLRQAAEEAQKPLAILLDLGGPKIRLGEIEGGAVEVKAADLITISSRKCVGTASLVSTNYVDLPKDVEPGYSIFVDDGLLEFVVKEVSETEVVCNCKTGGLLKSRKGLNIPQAALSTPSLTEKDKRDIEVGRDLGVDFFALSFVRRAEDVLEAKALAGNIPVIAKIEKPTAIANLEAIADVADGLMVARGDLAVEVGPERVPMLQKRMIRLMNQRAKPVITATQMLESMVSSPQPTRAEVSDVANAVLDGSDAVMLSAESAVGKYPFHAVRTMVRIISEVEQEAFTAGSFTRLSTVSKPSFKNAIAHAAAKAAIDLRLQAVAVYSITGMAAALVSAYRPQSQIIGMTNDPVVFRRLALNWGVTPVRVEWAEDMQQLLAQAEDVMLAQKLAAPGDQFALTHSRGFGDFHGATTLTLSTVRP